jgi:hypothetical protein
LGAVVTPDHTPAAPEDLTSVGSEVRALLIAYDRALAAARREGALAWVRARPPRSARGDWLWQLPRPTWFLQFFVVWHLDRTTRALQGTLSRRVGTGTATEVDMKDREAVEIYRSGLPPLRSKTLIVLLVIATVTFGRLALEHAGAVLSAVPVLQDVRDYRQAFNEEDSSRDPVRPQAAIEVREQAAKLIDDVGDAIGTDVSSVGKTLDAFIGASPVDVLLVLAGTLFALYAVTRPFMPAFRIKRLLLNLAYDPAARPYTTARWHVQQATGIYESERAIFARFGESAPREPALDLWIPALLWGSLPTALGIYLIVTAVSPVVDVWWGSPLLACGSTTRSVSGWACSWCLDCGSCG